MSSQRILFAAALTTLFLGTAGARIVDQGDMRRMVDVRNVSSAGDTVSGRLVNLTDSTLEDVTLLVEDSFLWRDEFHPGAESPSRAETVRIERVPPRSAVDFSIRRPEPIPRSDGRFETSVRVVGLTERSTPTEAPAQRTTVIPADR